MSVEVLLVILSFKVELSDHKMTKSKCPKLAECCLLVVVCPVCWTAAVATAAAVVN